MPDEQKPVMKPVEELEEKTFLHERELPPEAQSEVDVLNPIASPAPYHNQPFPNIIPQSGIAEEAMPDEEDEDGLP